MELKKKSEMIRIQQIRVYAFFIGVFALACIFAVFFLIKNSSEERPKKQKPDVQFDAVSKEIKPEGLRLANLENFNDVLSNRMQTLEKSVLDLKEEKALIEREKNQLTKETEELKGKMRSLEADLENRVLVPNHADEPHLLVENDLPAVPPLKIWESEEKQEDQNVLFEIPAGTVVKAVLVSGADCSVALQKPTGPNMVLLRPLDNGKLPKKVRVPLKGSILIGNAVGDISSERVYVRAERMTLVQRSGSFVETEVSAYVSGEDGREGLRGVVVDRSGGIISRVAFAAVLQGIGQTIQGTLNNQTIEKLAQTNSDKTILNIDMLRNSAFQGGSAALNKLAEYYIKKAEQLQPAIQIASGRIVDVVFTKTVKVGEKDLKRKFDRERKRQHG